MTSLLWLWHNDISIPSCRFRLHYSRGCEAKQFCAVSKNNIIDYVLDGLSKSKIVSILNLWNSSIWAWKAIITVTSGAYQITVDYLFVQHLCHGNNIIIKNFESMPCGRIHRWPVDSPNKGLITQEAFSCHDVIMIWRQWALHYIDDEKNEKRLSVFQLAREGHITFNNFSLTSYCECVCDSDLPCKIFTIPCHVPIQNPSEQIF